MEGAQQWPADGHEQAVIMDAIILIIKGCSITPEVNASVRKEKMDHKGYSPEAIEAFKKAFEEADANKDGLLDLAEWKVFYGKKQEFQEKQHGAVAKDLDEHLELKFTGYNKLTAGTAGVSWDDWSNGQKVVDFLFAKDALFIPPTEERMSQLKAPCDYDSVMDLQTPEQTAKIAEMNSNPDLPKAKVLWEQWLAFDTEKNGYISAENCYELMRPNYENMKTAGYTMPSEEFQRATIANIEKLSTKPGVYCMDYISFTSLRTKLYVERVEKNKAAAQ